MRRLNRLFEFAGIMGIASIKAIVESAELSGYCKPVQLIWSAKSRDDFYLSHHFKAIVQVKHQNFKYDEIISDDMHDVMQMFGHDLCSIKRILFIRPASHD